MLRIGTKQPQAERGNVDVSLLLTQPADQKGPKAESRGSGSQRLLHGVESAEEALPLHNYKAARMGGQPFGLVCCVERPLSLE
jgi:hypothetical protein